MAYFHHVVRSQRRQDVVRLPDTLERQRYQVVAVRVDNTACFWRAGIDATVQGKRLARGFPADLRAGCIHSGELFRAQIAQARIGGRDDEAGSVTPTDIAGRRMHVAALVQGTADAANGLPE